MFKDPKINLLIIAVLVVAAIWSIFRNPDDIRLGLDLKGGTRLTLQAEPTPDVPKITTDIMDSLHSVLERRVNALGVGEAVVQRAGQNRMIIEIPGVNDPDEAKARLGRVGNLEFRRKGPEGDWVHTGVGGKDLARARLENYSGEWVVSFELTSKGTEKFAELTNDLVRGNQPLAIFFDGEFISAPTVRSAIVDGRGQIEGGFGRDEAKDMVDTLNAGALPVDIKIVEENTVGPLLGQASISQSFIAGLAGLAMILAFMLLYYRGMGFVANIALIIYALLSFAAYKMIGVTFTLAGIAGFILSVGMAVDANILIFERTKEELKAGRSKWKAIEVGFERAFPSILDSNVTTLITCGLLWVLGTGAVKGFALTLAIGVAVSMFSAITVSRTFLYLINNASGQPAGGLNGLAGDSKTAVEKA